MSVYAIVLFIIVLGYAFYMGYNDGSIALATTVYSRSVKPRTAITITAIVKFVAPVLFFFIGAMGVADNISNSILNMEYFEGIEQRQAFAFILSGMLGATVWAAVSMIIKIPNTIWYTLLGGILGSSCMAFGFDSVLWTDYVLLNVVAMVLLAPIVGSALGFLLMKLTKRLLRRMPRRMSSLLMVLQRVNIVVIAGAFSVNNSQKMLGIIMLATGLGIATGAQDSLPLWMVIVIALAIALGILSGGVQIMNTVGRKLYKIQPIHSVVSQVSSAIVAIAGTALGISLGMGQTITSSVIGVGAAERTHSVNWKTVAKIIGGWCLTMPISMCSGAVFYLLIGKLIMGL